MKRLIVIWAISAAVAAWGLLTRAEDITQLVGGEHQSDPHLDGWELWERLVATKLVTMKDGLIVVPPQDQALQDMAEARRRGDPWPPPQPEAQDRLQLLEKLFDQHDRQGKAVRRAIIRWNETRTLIAVRDNREGPADHPVIAGDRKNLWSASDTHGRDVQDVPIELPEAFSYINGWILPVAGLGDWRVLLPAPLPQQGNERLRLTSTLADGHPSDLTIQIIGQFDPSASRLPGTIQIHWRCPQSPCGPESPAATVELHDIPIGAEQMSLSVAAIRHDGRLPVPGLQLHARSADALPEWRPLTHRARRLPMRESIVTADGVPLWQDGHATAAAASLNLLPVVGVERHHGWSLAGRMASRPDDKGDIRLQMTIDSTVQSAAQQALTSMIEERFPQSRADDAFWRNKRRATMIVLNPQTGAVLAAAQWPPTPNNLSGWDYGAMAAGSPDRDLMLTMGWATNVPPGSCMKPVLDLAVLQAAQDSPVLASAVQGCAPQGDGTLSCLGLNLHQKSILLPGQSCRKAGCGIKNFQSNHGIESLDDVFKRPARSARCGIDKNHPVFHEINMAAALAVSNNSYHVRVADLLDGVVARRYDDAARHRHTRGYNDLPDLQDSLLVGMMAGKLGLFQDGDLAGDLAKYLGQGRSRSSLRITPAESELRDLADSTARSERPTGALDALAQTAIGQRMGVSALKMAQVAAAIQTASRPQPHLIAAINEQHPALHTEVIGIADLTPIQQGMKAVVESTAGTAFDAFGGPDDGPLQRRDEKSEWLRTARCGISGKTGTAELHQAADSKAVNSGWFIGFADAGVVNQPLAFACNITPIHGELKIGERILPTRTGGATCAPAVADFLYRLAKIRPALSH